MKKSNHFLNRPDLILRIGIAGEFMGHGVFALMTKPGWIPYFTSVGISESLAGTLLPLIGTLDLIVAAIVLFKPYKFVLAWATFWGLTTALIQPISGEPIWDFVERFVNFAASLALLSLNGIPKKFKDWFKA